VSADEDAIRRGAHLPKLRDGQRPPHPDWLPRQRRGTTPGMIGRYPDFDVLATTDTWDDVTRREVLARLEPPGPLRFFTADEEPALRALCDAALAQEDEPRIPVAEAVDAKLADGRLDGYQYAGMPDDRDTWRLVLRGLDEAARAEGRAGFADCDGELHFRLLGRLEEGRLDAPALAGLDEKRAWSVVMRAMLAAFYSHPWAWNEIGFGGPAYPRGFMRRGPLGYLEPFEQPGAMDADPVRDPRERG
jgi:hypothetical protein